MHLLPRFYDAQEGRITIDGHDITEVTVESLRDAIGIALQTVFLFDASIGENIAYGNPHATQHEIEWAARVVQMHDFIQSLPLGYGTPVGERGVRLSGGQKQRIALARVLLTDPRILILDEPTSSVDADTERRMQQALAEVRAGRTTFVIAHRLWTVQQADQILVLRDGRIVERARSTPERSAHEALLAAGGFYRPGVRAPVPGRDTGEPRQALAQANRRGKEGHDDHSWRIHDPSAGPGGALPLRRPGPAGAGHAVALRAGIQGPARAGAGGHARS